MYECDGIFQPAYSLRLLSARKRSAIRMVFPLCVDGGSFFMLTSMSLNFVWFYFQLEDVVE